MGWGVGGLGILSYIRCVGMSRCEGYGLTSTQFSLGQGIIYRETDQDMKIEFLEVVWEVIWIFVSSLE